ncbi:universal stress protein [Tepidimonas sp.]|uniref:universal stress protein n=1 Tax=Tepidimonas sp. TaxID=2002775 RepID=UPI002FE3F7C5
MTLFDEMAALVTDPTLAGAIVVASDFSTAAARAQQRAVQMARECRAPLVLVHILPQDGWSVLQNWLGAGVSTEAVAAAARDSLQAQAAAAGQRGDIEVRAVLLAGHPVQTLATLASATQARLLVVGALGQGSVGAQVRRLLLGTTAERLLRKTTRPMLLVRCDAGQPYRRVLVPVDFSPWTEPALDWVDALLPHAHVRLLHAYRVPFEEKLRFAGVPQEVIARYRDKTRERAFAQLQALAQARGWTPARYVLQMQEADAAPAIVEAAQSHDCDLVVIGKHGTSAAEDLLLGSVTKHVVAEAPCDVLMSPAHAGVPAMADGG